MFDRGTRPMPAARPWKIREPKPARKRRRMKRDRRGRFTK